MNNKFNTMKALPNNELPPRYYLRIVALPPLLVAFLFLNSTRFKGFNGGKKKQVNPPTPFRELTYFDLPRK